jgi:methylated-DNA-[protein]-cysteine S-methyltransferase
VILYTHYESSLGKLLMQSDGQVLTGLHFHDEKHVPRQEADWQLDPDLPVFERTRTQLDEYFSGTRREFDVPIRPMGTEFQRRVWEVLLRIPYGVTTTYGAMARDLGQPTAMRAVGAANGRNPISIIVPCHRAIGADGTLTGYAGGLYRKRALLELESTTMPLFGKVAAAAVPGMPANNEEKR